MIQKSKQSTFLQFFYFAMRWNALESIVYQLIYVIHQVVLFQIISSFAFANMAVYFSYIYLLIPLLNLGLDKSLFSFFKQYSLNKKSFISIVVYQCIIQTVIVTTIGLLLYILYGSINTTISLLLIAIIVAESLKKTVKTLCQISFLNNYTALIEIAGIILYVVLFWSMYFITGLVTPLTIFVPMLIESLFCLIACIVIYIPTYKKLDRGNVTDTNISLIDIAQQRFFIYISQLSSLLFSTNLILVAIARMYGIATIAHISLVKSIVAFLVSFIEKTFGVTSGSFLSRSKGESKHITQDAFFQAAQPLYNTLFIILLGAAVGYLFFYYSKLNACNFIDVSNAFLFLCMILVNNLYIPQEQFLIVQNKIYYLFFLNMINALVFYLFFLQYLSLTITLSLFIFLRIMTLLVLNYVIKKKLSIQVTLVNNCSYHVGVGALLFITIALLNYHYCFLK